MRSIAPSYSGQTPFFLRLARKGGPCITGFGPVDGGSKQKLFFLEKNLFSFGKRKNLWKRKTKKEKCENPPGAITIKEKKRNKIEEKNKIKKRKKERERKKRGEENMKVREERKREFGFEGLLEFG